MLQTEARGSGDSGVPVEIDPGLCNRFAQTPHFHRHFESDISISHLHLGILSTSSPTDALTAQPHPLWTSAADESPGKWHQTPPLRHLSWMRLWDGLMRGPRRLCAAGRGAAEPKGSVNTFNAMNAAVGVSDHILGRFHLSHQR